ncbi:MAG: glycosyltransferase family 2 protein, partial [Promethearchaeota archaeon]
MLKMKVKGSGYTSDDVNRKENRVPKEEVSMLPDLTIPPTTLPIDVKATATQRGTEPVVKRDNWPDQTTKDPKVGVSMIVKNEGKVLRRCLESVKDHVDEIVIVDTGSTDDTIAIAKEFGAKVFEHPWEDSFSVARNQAIAHTNCQWLLQIDGDEELQACDGPKIRDAVRSAHKTTTNLIHMVLENIDETSGERKSQSIINTGKLMRVIPTLHFVNRVHNK